MYARDRAWNEVVITHRVEFDTLMDVEVRVNTVSNRFLKEIFHVNSESKI